MLSVYRIYHRHLASAIELPELPLTTGTPELEFRVERLPAAHGAWFDIWTHPDERPWVRVQRVGPSYRVRYEDRVDFLLDVPRAAILADPFNCEMPPLRHFLLDQVVPLFLSLDHTVLHAGAAMVDGRACAFAGQGGAGKSTLIAAFARAGHAIVTDDGLLIVPGDPVRAVPAYPGLRLWPDSAAVYASGEAVAASAGPLKTRVGESLPFAGGSAPLEDLFLIDPIPAKNVRIDAVSGRDAVVALLEHSYRLQLGGRAALRAQLERSVGEAASLRAWHLSYPRQFDRAEEVVAAIVARLRARRRATVRTYAAG